MRLQNEECFRLSQESVWGSFGYLKVFWGGAGDYWNFTLFTEHGAGLLARRLWQV